MESSSELPLIVSVPRPNRGSSTRIRLGTAEVVLERVRGGHSLLWSDGRQARRFALGLAESGHLTLELRAPRLPLRVVAREVISLVPGSRLRSYLQVPLIPTLVWHHDGGPPLVIVDLPPRELTAEWDDREGHSFRCASALHVRFPMRSGEPRAVVPIHLRNPCESMASPAHVPLQLLDAELVPMRGSIVVRPRRLTWTGECFATEVPRAGVQVWS